MLRDGAMWDENMAKNCYGRHTRLLAVYFIGKNKRMVVHPRVELGLSTSREPPLGDSLEGRCTTVMLMNLQFGMLAHDQAHNC